MERCCHLQLKKGQKASSAFDLNKPHCTSSALILYLKRMFCTESGLGVTSFCYLLGTHALSLSLSPVITCHLPSCGLIAFHLHGCQLAGNHEDCVWVWCACQHAGMYGCQGTGGHDAYASMLQSLLQLAKGSRAVVLPSLIRRRPQTGWQARSR